MRKVTVSEILRQRLPMLRLGCIECNVKTVPSPEELTKLITRKCSDLRQVLKIEDISSLPAIKASRSAYKLCGKDPARYRLSAEALLRRIVKGEGLYFINNVVDGLNLVSISTGFSIGGYDAGKIEDDVEMGIGKAGEEYEGIGRGPLNIEGLPVFRDASGAFGSPTSDSVRTAVSVETRRFLMIIIDFNSSSHFDQAIRFACELLENYANADNIRVSSI